MYNHATKQVIDLAKCPIEDVWYSRELDICFVSRLSPLPLLITIGNGRGGGDLYNDPNKLVGSWCDTIQQVEVRFGRIFGNNYTEFAPDFSEHNPPIPYTEEAEMVRKEKERVLGMS